MNRVTDFRLVVRAVSKYPENLSHTNNRWEARFTQ